MGKGMRRAQAIYDRTLEAIKDKTFQLIYVQRDDGLTDEQVASLLAGEDFDDSMFDDWVSEERYFGARHVIENELDLSEDDRDRLERHNLLDELRFAVQDRDSSDVVKDLMRGTHHKLFRYSLDWSYDGETWGLTEQEFDDVASEVAEAACLDLTDAKVKEKVIEMIANAGYGGRLYVMIYTSVEDALTLNAAARTDDNGKPIDQQQGTVTFPEGAYLIMLDHWNGSGHDVKMPVPVTVPWFPGRVSLDSQGPGYGWDQIAGVVASAYGVDFTTTPTPTDEESS